MVTGGARAARWATRWRTWLIVLAGLVVFAARQPGGLARPYLWAEDGTQFLADSLADPFSVFDVYAGQLFVLQRVLFLLLRPLPLEWAPRLVFLVGVAVVVGSCATVLQQRLAGLLGGPRRQAAAFGLLLLLPGTWQVDGNIVNVHWWIVFSVALILLAPAARTRLGEVAELVWLGVGALSGMTAIIVGPVALAALIRSRSRAVLARVVVLAAGGLAQLYVLHESTRAVSGSLRLVTFAKLIVVKVGAVLLIGSGNTVTDLSGTQQLAVYAASGALLAVAAWVTLRSTGTAGAAMWAAGLLCAEMGIYAAPRVHRWFSPMAAGRYFVPMLGFVVLTLVMATGKGTRGNRRLAAACLVVCAFGFAGDAVWVSPTPIDPAAWRTFTSCVASGPAPCSVNIAPADWVMTVPRPQ